MKDSGQKNLIRRYLLWCYKTTKEELDHIDRKSTQLMVDHFILKFLLNGQRYALLKSTPGGRKYIERFKVYISQKQKEYLKSKYLDPRKKRLNPQYLYLNNRLKAVEASIQHFLGKRELASIKTWYEDEMVKRILEAREHS